MSEKRKKVPQLRFPEFCGEWEELKLSELATFSKGSGYTKGDLVEIGKPIILYGRLYTKYETVISEVDTFVSDNSGAVLSEGNEVIVPASGETAGDIARAAVVDKKGIVLGGDLNIIRPKSGIDQTFLALNISNGSQQKEMMKRAQGKSIVHLHNSDLKEVLLKYPSIEEQLKISKFFNKFDHLTALHQCKLTHLQTRKKGLLQKMFPKDGELFPELRFPGFTDAWEVRKSEEIFYSVTDKNHIELPVLSASQEHGMVRRDEIGIDIKYDEKSTNTYKRVVPGQFIIHLRSFQGGFAYANIEGITSPAYTVLDFKKKEKYYPLFWREVLTSKNFIKRLETVTYGIRDGRSISFSDFSTLKFNVPSYEEQKVIGDYFKKFNTLITLHQRKLEHLQDRKKALLQQMFV